MTAQLQQLLSVSDAVSHPLIGSMLLKLLLIVRSESFLWCWSGCTVDVVATRRSIYRPPAAFFFFFLKDVCQRIGPVCGGGVSLSVRGRAKCWVTSQQQSPGQHLHGDQLEEDKAPSLLNYLCNISRTGNVLLIILLLSTVTHTHTPQTVKWNLTRGAVAPQ